MRMSTRGRYGARVMLELALNYKNGALSIKDMAERQDISAKYLVQIITTLKAAGLVVSIRGSGGGYVWVQMKKSVDSIINSLDLEEMAKRQKKKRAKSVKQ